MGRRQSDNRHKAFELYEKSGGTKLCKDIAAALGVSDSQVRNWKVKDKWNDKVAQSKNIVAQLKRNPAAPLKATGTLPATERRKEIKTPWATAAATAAHQAIKRERSTASSPRYSPTMKRPGKL